MKNCINKHKGKLFTASSKCNQWIQESEVAECTTPQSATQEMPTNKGIVFPNYTLVSQSTLSRNSTQHVLPEAV